MKRIHCLWMIGLALFLFSACAGRQSQTSNEFGGENIPSEGESVMENIELNDKAVVFELKSALDVLKMQMALEKAVADKAEIFYIKVQGEWSGSEQMILKADYKSNNIRIVLAGDAKSPAVFKGQKWDITASNIEIRNIAWLDSGYQLPALTAAFSETLKLENVLFDHIKMVPAMPGQFPAMVEMKPRPRTKPLPTVSMNNVCFYGNDADIVLSNTEILSALSMDNVQIIGNILRQPSFNISANDKLSLQHIVLHQNKADAAVLYNTRLTPELSLSDAVLDDDSPYVFTEAFPLNGRVPKPLATENVQVTDTVMNDATRIDPAGVTKISAVPDQYRDIRSLREKILKGAWPK